MRNLFIALLVVTTLCFTAIVALAAPPPSNATAAVTVTVDVIGEWAGNFSTIALSTITAQGSTPTGSQTATLYTNGNVSITANNSGTTAQLKKITDPNQTLVTSYMLTDDGDGTTTTGGTNQTIYTGYATFLSSAYAITHVAGDGEDVITLHAKAANYTGEVADAGAYSATQTLTATW
jgi:hypothetical protein